MNRLGLIFDLDGTLIDSVGDLAAAASELVTQLGGRTLAADEVAEMVGDGAGVLVRRALTTAGLSPDALDALPRFLEIYDRRLLDTTTAYVGVREALEMSAARARLSVLTNKPAAPARQILQALDLERYFDAIVGGDGPHPRKPSPAGLMALAGGAAHVMLVGDSPVDWQTTRAAGCAFVWARYGFGARRFGDAPPDTPYVLDEPSDLAGVLDRFIEATYEPPPRPRA